MNIIKELSKLHDGDIRESEILRTSILKQIDVIKAYLVEGLYFREIDKREFGITKGNGGKSARIIYWMGMKGLPNLQGIFKDQSVENMILYLERSREAIEISSMSRIEYIINLLKIDNFKNYDNEFEEIVYQYELNYMKEFDQLKKITSSKRLEEPFKSLISTRKKLENYIDLKDLKILFKSFNCSKKESELSNESFLNLAYLYINEVEKSISYKELIETTEKIDREMGKYDNAIIGKKDYITQEINNMFVGFIAEKWVVEFEKKKLLKAKQYDLVDKIEHISNIKGDGFGYDIVSYDENRNKIFIEVKGTTARMNIPFYVTKNEINASNKYKDKYYLYRVFDILDNSPKVFIENGKIEVNFELNPILFEAK